MRNWCKTLTQNRTAGTRLSEGPAARPIPHDPGAVVPGVYADPLAVSRVQRT